MSSGAETQLDGVYVDLQEALALREKYIGVDVINLCPSLLEYGTRNIHF